MNGTVFDIQSYSIYDGPGIRTTIFLKGCPLSCAWCQNPESIQAGREIGFLAEKCAGCGRCVDACRHGARRVVDKKSFRDPERCRACGECAAACPNGAISVIGVEMSPEEVVARVLPDIPFYEMSGGGATFSGGEPTRQGGFLVETLLLLRGRGVRTAVETCGLYPPDFGMKLAGSADLFLFDMKHPDPGVHLRRTGAGNGPIIRNFRALLAAAGPERMIVRIPLIPGVNADRRTIGGIVSLLKAEHYMGRIELMPYNRLSKTKWAMVGRAAHFTDFGELSKNTIAEACDEVRAGGFEVAVSG